MRERLSVANPDVKIRPSGEQYVTAADVLRSDRGRALIRRTAEARKRIAAPGHSAKRGWRGWGSGNRAGVGVDLAECDRRDKYGRCDHGPPCAICGYHKHYAVHALPRGAAPGSPPCDHEYTPEPT